MNIVVTLLTIVFVLIAIAVTVLVLLQEGKSNGLSGSLGGGSGSESYWGKNKARSGEAKMAKFTSLLTVIFMIFAIALNILM